MGAAHLEQVVAAADELRALLVPGKGVAATLPPPSLNPDTISPSCILMGERLSSRQGGRAAESERAEWMGRTRGMSPRSGETTVRPMLAWCARETTVAASRVVRACVGLREQLWSKLNPSTEEIKSRAPPRKGLRAQPM